MFTGIINDVLANYSNSIKDYKGILSVNELDTNTNTDIKYKQ